MMLKAVRAPATVQRAVKKVMRHWVTEIEIRTEGTTVREPVRFRRGLFQGDSLSPLLFVLAVAPLSSFLGLSGGFSSPHHESPVTHLLFMDDLKVFEENKVELDSTVEGSRRRWA